MTGMTPEVFTLSGMFVVWPPTIFLPCTFFAYCTGILRTPSFKMITSTTISTIIAMIMIAATTPLAMDLPITNCSKSCAISWGIRERMLIVSTMEIPFPTPLSVIRSPIHIRKALPAVSAAITVMMLITL